MFSFHQRSLFTFIESKVAHQYENIRVMDSCTVKSIGH